MRHTLAFRWCAALRTLLFVGAMLVTAGVCNAQLANPLLPSGVGSARDLESYSRGGGSGGLGPSLPGERNPADVLLNEINGANRGRRTGRAALRGTRPYRARRVDLSSPQQEREDKQAVFFDRRGAYEDAIYTPTRGTYRTSTRRPRATSSPAPRAGN
ncbi:MAG TPA: hypothetical protein VJ783_16865 [Pirellulales bacterium]|nr:hypothetical protein [Pirellulales bacterium]